MAQVLDKCQFVKVNNLLIVNNLINYYERFKDKHKINAKYFYFNLIRNI